MLLSKDKQNLLKIVSFDFLVVCMQVSVKKIYLYWAGTRAAFLFLPIYFCLQIFCRGDKGKFKANLAQYFLRILSPSYPKEIFGPVENVSLSIELFYFRLHLSLVADQIFRCLLLLLHHRIISLVILQKNLICRTVKLVLLTAPADLYGTVVHLKIYILWLEFFCRL